MEFKRTLLSRTFLFTLAALLLFNVWFFVYQNSNTNDDFRYYGELYDDIVDDFANLSWQEGYEECVRIEEEIKQQIFNSLYDNDPDLSYKLQIIEELKLQYAHLIGYEDYIDQIQTNADTLQSVSIFSRVESFSYKNTIKTARDFSKLKGIELSFGHDRALNSVFEDGWMDIFVIIPTFLICGLFFIERKKGLHTLVYGAPGGRGKLALKRVSILFLSSLVSVLLLFGTKILLNAWLYGGLGELGRTLQSVSTFYNVPIPMTVGEFWAGFMAFKTLSVFWIGLMFWSIMQLNESRALSICFMGIFIGVEYACTFISSSSFFAILRYANFFSYINYIPVFTRYLNISVFGLVISGNRLVLAALPLLSAGFAFSSVFIAEKKYPISKKSSLISFCEALKQKISSITSGGGIFIQELKKIFISGKGILTFIILCILLSQTGMPTREETPLDMYLEFYEQKYAGEITEETIAALESELSGSSENNRTAALNVLISRVENASSGDWIVPSAIYEALFSPQRYHYTAGLIALLFLVLIISPIASQERQADMTYLLRSTPSGRGRLWANKQYTVLFSSVLIWASVYGAELIKSTYYYGNLSCLAAPVSSLSAVYMGQLSTTIGGALVLLYGLRLLTIAVVGEICFCLSGLCKRNMSSLLLCCGVILIPAALAAIGSELGKRFSVMLTLAAVDYLPTAYPFITVGAVGCLAALSSRITSRIK